MTQHLAANTALILPRFAHDGIWIKGLYNCLSRHSELFRTAVYHCILFVAFKLKEDGFPSTSSWSPLSWAVGRLQGLLSIDHL